MVSVTGAAQSVIVVGGGAMGLASAWALARRGAAVTVLERFDVVNDRSSHGGFTRVIRQAYHEGSNYVPLIVESETEWLALGRRVEEQLLVRTGLLEFGPPDHPELLDAIGVCEAMGIDHEVTDAATAMRRWPFAMPDDWTTCFTPSGGYLRVRPCLEAFRAEAEAAGAVVRSRVAVERVVQSSGSVAVELDDGSRMSADRIVVTAGPWLPSLLPPALRGREQRGRRVLAWSNPQGGRNDALRRLPVWGAFLQHGFFYGFPLSDEGVTGLKLACHTNFLAEESGYIGRPIEPDTVDRAVAERDLAPLAEILAAHIPDGVGPWAHHAVCMYTATPSWDFLLDRLPDDPRVVVAGGFSGHGFKFAPAIGRLVAELTVTDVGPRHDFSFDRHLKDATS